MPIKSSTLQQAESCTCPKKNGAPALHWSHVNPRPGQLATSICVRNAK